MTTLITDRLMLRAFSATDYAPLSHVCASAEVMALALTGKPLSGKQFAGLIQRDFAHSEDEKLGLGTLCLKQNGLIIGFSGIIPCAYLQGTACAGVNDIELVLMIDRKFWEAGYATEIGKALLRYALGELGYPRLLALASPRNHRSLRVIGKLEMNAITELDTPDRGIRTVFEKRQDAYGA